MLALGGIGTIIYFTTKSTEIKEQSQEKGIQQIQEQLSQIKKTLNKPENSAKKVKYSVQLADIENQLKNFPQTPRTRENYSANSRED